MKKCLPNYFGNHFAVEGIGLWPPKLSILSQAAPVVATPGDKGPDNQEPYRGTFLPPKLRRKISRRRGWGSNRPEGPARHLDASRQKLTPHCLATIFDSHLPSPELSLKMPPKLPLPHNRGHFFLFQNCPHGEGNCAAIEQQKLSRGNFCLAASRCLSGPSGRDPDALKARSLTPARHTKLVLQCDCATETSQAL